MSSPMPPGSYGFLTAVASESGVREAIEIGISDYIVKPYRLNVLQEKVSRILGE